MKSLLATFFLLTLAVCGCAAPPSAIRGDWVVTEVRFGGVSAMSADEAMNWIGRTMRIGDVSTSLDGERLSGCRVTESRSDSEEYFVDNFKILPSELGFTDKKVRQFEVEDADGREWIAPGSTIIVGKKLVLTYWDGAFFVLQKKEPKDR